MTVPITPLEPDASRSDPAAGLGALGTERGNLPLESLDVSADVTGLTAAVEVVQGFRNAFDVPLEATYVFPLPDRAAVTAFRMEAADRVVEGVLEERGRARADYDRALAEGRRAAIAEEDRPDVFTMRVGNILPGERVRVRLALTQPLPYEDGAATFRFPLVVAQRYIPGSPLDDAPAGRGTAPDTDAVPDASRITPPVLLPGFPDPVRLSLAVRVRPAGLDLRGLGSSLHAVATEESAEGTSVRLRPGERLDRDFVLRMSFAASTSLVLVPDEETEQAGEGTFALTVLPEEAEEGAEEERAPRDVVLVLDRSGSMKGWKMVAARRAAARIVDTLTAADRFAVLSFDTVVERPGRLPAGLAEATDRHRYRAVEHLARMDARGGTELLAPLAEALALLGEGGGSAAEDGRDRVLVLVTDGQVGNEDEILERLGTGLAAVRVHTVGIDRAVNAGFLGRLAGLGAGRCELVESEDRLDEAMEHIHRRVGAPLVTDLTVAAEGFETVEDTVTRPGSLFPGVPLTVSGRYRGPAPEAAALTLHGWTSAGTAWRRRVAAAPGGGGRAARDLWARAHLRALEDRYAVGERALEERIVADSLRYGVLCRFTAFVAADTRVAAEGGPRHRVIQPVESPSGWEEWGTAPSPGNPGFVAADFTAGPAGDAAAPQGGFGPMAGHPQSAAADGAADVARGARGALRGRRPAQARLSRSRPAPAALPGSRTGRSPGGLAAIRPQLVAELDRLRRAEPLPERARLRHLADLGSRLAALARHLGDAPELAELAAELERAERPGADLDALWHRVVAVLTTLTASGDGSAARPEPKPPGRAFWRRP